MNTMSVNATAAPFHAAVADTRDTAQAIIEDLRQPNDKQTNAASKHAPGSQPLHMRTPGLSCGTRGAACTHLARLRPRPSRPGGPVA